MLTRPCYHRAVPKLVDHDQRRAELSAAAIRVMQRDGLDGVTVRGVAAEAGWSTGSLRHYFADQRELQERVVAVATDRLRDLVLPRVRRPRPGLPVIELVAQVVEELLPLDDQRREEYAVWVAIVEWERRHLPAGGSRTWADQRALHWRCVARLRGHAGSDDQGVAPVVDPELEVWAALLHTFVDGLASQLVNTPGEMPAHRARSLLRALLSAVPTRVTPRPTQGSAVHVSGRGDFT